MIGGSRIMANNFEVPDRKIRKQQSRNNFFMPGIFLNLFFFMNACDFKNEFYRIEKR